MHINAGIAGGILALIIGHRVGFMKDPMRPHNLTLTMIGAGLLWFGWYGFNVGSIVFTSADSSPDVAAQFQGETGVTFLNTTIATCAAMLGWLLMERILHGKAHLAGCRLGHRRRSGRDHALLWCGRPDRRDRHRRRGRHPLRGGRRAEVQLNLTTRWTSSASPGRRSRRHPADRPPVDLVAPAASTASSTAADLASLGDQTLAALFTIVWTGVLTTVIALAIKYTIGWRWMRRPRSRASTRQHGESAYDLHTSTARGCDRCARRLDRPAHGKGERISSSPR